MDPDDDRGLRACQGCNGTFVNALVTDVYEKLGVVKGRVRDVDGNWNKIGQGLGGQWHFAGTITSAAIEDKMKGGPWLKRVPGANAEEPKDRYTCKKSVSQNWGVNSRAKVDVVVGNGHSKCGVRVKISQRVDLRIFKVV